MTNWLANAAGLKPVPPLVEPPKPVVRKRTSPAIQRGERALSLVPLAEHVLPFALKLVKDDRPFTLGMIPVPAKLLTNTCLMVGVSGSGKSLCLKNLVIDGFNHRKEFRAVVSQTKDDWQGFLETAVPQANVIDLNPFNDGAYAVRFDTLLNHQGIVDDFASLLIPDDEQQFFVDAARDGFSIVINHFRTNKRRFTLRDIYLAVTSQKTFKHIANQSGEGPAFLERHSPDRQWAGVISGMAQAVRKLKFVADASHIHETEKRSICIRAFAERTNDVDVLLLGDEDEAETAMKAYNRTLVFCLSKLLRKGPHEDYPKNAIVLDEVLPFADFPFDKVPDAGRAKGLVVWAATQSLQDLVDRSRKAHDSSWALRADTKLFFRVSVDDAKLASEYFGKAYRAAYAFNHGNNVGRTDGWGISGGPNGTTTGSINQSDTVGYSDAVNLQLELTDAVPPHCMATDLAKASPSRGAVGFVTTDPEYFGGLWFFCLPFHLWPPKPESNVKKLNMEFIETVPWGPDDYERLGLTALLRKRCEANPLTPSAPPSNDSQPYVPGRDFNPLPRSPLS